MKFNTIVFVSYENHYAPWGGLAAVMKMLPPIMSKSIKTVLISPFFSNNNRTKESIDNKKLKETNLKDHIFYKGFSHTVNIYKSTEYLDFKDYSIFLVKSEKFFLSGENPYLDTWRFDSLIHDSYFFSKSIPVVLKLIRDEFPPPYILNLQDWETALVADLLPTSIPHKCVLTIHNPYDEYLYHDPQGRTILQFTIPKMQGLSTVSEHFAYELNHDVLVHDVLSQKLIGQFQSLPPIGINNGNFVKLSFPENISDPDLILNEKLNNRRIFNSLLKERKDLTPKWGNKIDLIKSDIPIFLIFGRDSPKQKGFDVAAAAIYNLLKRKGTNSAHFIFAPVPSQFDLINLAYLEDLCREFGNNVMVFPFRLSKGYEELQKSVNYIIMPSYYEPFGAAHEGYASGTPVIGRATGGLIQQICPKNYTSLPKLIQKYVGWYHNDIAKPTGYLYREDLNTETVDNWKYLLSTDFSKRRSIQEPVDWRNPIFWSMVTELENVLEQAIILYNEKNKTSYCEMVLNGLNLFKKYSWEKSAEQYRTLLYKI